jgi:kinesin family protein 1
MASSAGNIVVAVRCRPLNSREITRGAKGLIRIINNQVMLDAPDATDLDPGNAKSHAAKAHSFAFDHAYNSMCSKDDPEYASQAQLFDDLGVDLLNHAFEGYNVC